VVGGQPPAKALVAEQAPLAQRYGDKRGHPFKPGQSAPGLSFQEPSAHFIMFVFSVETHADGFAKQVLS